MGEHMDRFALHGKFVAQPGERDALVEVLLDAANLLEEVPACHLYIVNVPEDDPDAVWVTEVWSSAEAHSASLQDERVQAIVKRGRPLIADMPQQVKLKSLGGKGLP
jgi:quinol monooxygenase YgiN